MLLPSVFIFPSAAYWWSNACASLLISCILVSILIPQILLISFRKRLFDQQNERKIHQGIIPRLGGIIFVPAILFSLIFLLSINLYAGEYEIISYFRECITEFFLGFCAVTLLYLIGIADDLIGIRYRTKFFVQTMSGLLLAASGLWINNLYGLFGIHSLPPFAGYLLTIIVVVFIINAINLIDGIDGLASGLSGIALLHYGTLFMLRGQYAYALLAYSVLGVLAAFFYYNVFGSSGHKRKIFMGDTGSMTIGFILSFLSIAICVRPSATGLCDNSFVAAFAPLLVPCFDVLRVFLHRLRNGKPPFAPDKNHIHHKLLDIGWSQRQVLVSLLALSVVLTALNIGCSPWVNLNLLLAADILCWTLLNVWLTKAILKKKRRKQEEENRNKPVKYAT